MQRMTHLMATLLLGFTIVSCSHAPKVLNETDTVLQIREDYLRANPNGPFNERIARGEVEKGMNFLEVLAAWGLPDTRGLSQDRKFEYWMYFSQDDLSMDWTQYRFVFEKSALADWELTRHVTKSPSLVYWRAQSDFSATQPAISPPGAVGKQR